MKKKMIKVAFVAVIAMVMGHSAYNAHSKKTLSDLALVNIEALADPNEGGKVTCCPDKGDSCTLSSGDVLIDQDEC